MGNGRAHPYAVPLPSGSEYLEFLLRTLACLGLLQSIRTRILGEGEGETTFASFLSNFGANSNRAQHQVRDSLVTHGTLLFVGLPYKEGRFPQGSGNSLSELQWALSLAHVNATDTHPWFARTAPFQQPQKC